MKASAATLSSMKYLAILAFLAAAPLTAQFDTAEVLGTVHDASDSAVSKASVTLLNQDTGIQARSTTDENGNYTFSNVHIGKYTVSAEAPGFSKAVAKDVIVNVNARQRVDLNLQVGAVTDTVEVTAAAAALETDTSARGQVINTSAVVELPLNGRSYSDLALLTTGVVRSPSASSREGSFVVNGLRSTFNNYLLDGVDNNAYGTSNQGFANQAAQPSPDSIAEFKVITNNYSAEYGRSGGATIDVALRSGTNQLHGTVYDFLRNTDLNAIGYTFGARPAVFYKPTLQQNQFGLTVGGPIVRNRLFFFSDYEGFRSLQRALSFSSIPTLTERQSILPVAVTNPQTGAIYPANTPIPVTATSAFARKVLSELPDPTGAGRSNNYQALLLTRTYSDKYDAKLDGQINSRMSAAGRFSQRKSNQYVQPNIPGPSGGGGNGYVRAMTQQGQGSYTWILDSTSVVEARFAVTRTRAGKTPPYIGGASMDAEYGIPGLPADPALTGGLVPTALSGYTALGRQSTNPQFQNPTHYDWKVNYSKIAGRHSVKVGVEYVVLHTEVLDVNPLYGNDTYAGAFSRPAGGPADNASYGVADFLFGLRSAYQLANYVVGNYRQREYFGYLQDDFRVSNRLTINAGLRWEYATPRWERDNVLSNFDPATLTMVPATDGGIYDRALVDPDRKDFAPRLGFAYSATGKTVVRGGYGISYIHQNRVGSGDLLGINGPQVVIGTVNQSNPLDPGFLTTQQGYPASIDSPANFNPAAANVLYIPRNLKTPYVQSWFVSVQRELASNLIFDVGYIGNHSVAIPLMADYNQANPQPTATSTLSLQARRPIPSYGAISWYDPAGFSSYNGLQLKLDRRFANGLQFLNSFTWSKAIDTNAQTLDGSNGNQSSVQNVRDLKNERGISNYDQTLVDVFSATWQFPFGRARKYGSSLPGAVDQVLGGWQLSMINNALSAPRLTCGPGTGRCRRHSRQWVTWRNGAAGRRFALT